MGRIVVRRAKVHFVVGLLVRTGIARGSHVDPLGDYCNIVHPELFKLNGRIVAGGSRSDYCRVKGNGFYVYSVKAVYFGLHVHSPFYSR